MHVSDLIRFGGVRADEIRTDVCFQCGFTSIEVNHAVRQEDGIRIDYWCPVCQGHRHHTQIEDSRS